MYSKFVKLLQGRCLPTEQDFTRPIVQTRPGEPGRLSGIPPALFTLAVSSFLENKDPTLHVKFERPLKLNVSPELMQSLTESCNSIVSAYAHEDIIKLISPATGNGVGSTPPSKKNHRRRISSLALTTSQVHYYVVLRIFVHFRFLSFVNCVRRVSALRTYSDFFFVKTKYSVLNFRIYLFFYLQVLVQAQIEDEGASHSLQLGFYGCNVKAAAAYQRSSSSHVFTIPETTNLRNFSRNFLCFVFLQGT